MRTPSFKDETIDNCDYLINDSIDFDNDNKICLEIGMGKGDFIIGMALNNPIIIILVWNCIQVF